MLDPTLESCKLVNSFEEDIDKKWTPNFFCRNKIYKLTPSKNISDNFFCCEKKLAELEKLQNNFNSEDYKFYRNIHFPFENLPKTIFSNRAAIKLANIDCLFELFGETFDILHSHSERQISFCDIAGGPGSFTEYIHYRFPNSKGYGITLSKDLDWSSNVKKVIEPFYGEDGSGDLIKYYNNFISFVISKNVNGVDYCVADGGFFVNTQSNQNYVQETSSYELKKYELITGISCLKKRGNFVLKVFGTVTQGMRDLILISSYCFEKITLFKPSFSRNANSEKYLVCMNKKENVREYIEILKNGFISKDRIFDEWLIKSNNFFIENQIEISTKIVEKITDSEDYDLLKPLKIWNIPEKINSN